MKWKVWAYSMGASVIGGAASTAAAMIVDPKAFNFDDLPKLGKLAIAGAVISLVFFLKQSPLPKINDEN